MDTNRISYPESTENYVNNIDRFTPLSNPKYLFLLTVLKHPKLSVGKPIIVAGNMLHIYTQLQAQLKVKDKIDVKPQVSYNDIASTYRKRKDTIIRIFENDQIIYEMKCMPLNGKWINGKSYK